MAGVEGEGVRMWFVKKIEYAERFNMKKNIDILCAYLLSHETSASILYPTICLHLHHKNCYLDLGRVEPTKKSY